MVELVICIPIDESTDTPIQKITIQPAAPNDSTHQPERSRSLNHGRITDEPPTIIKVSKKLPKKSTPSTIIHPKKYDTHLHKDDNRIYYTRAKINGSFRHKTVKSRDARQRQVFRIKPAELIHFVTLTPETKSTR